MFNLCLIFRCLFLAKWFLVGKHCVYQLELILHLLTLPGLFLSLCSFLGFFLGLFGSSFLLLLLSLCFLGSFGRGSSLFLLSLLFESDSLFLCLPCGFFLCFSLLKLFLEQFLLLPFLLFLFLLSFSLSFSRLSFLLLLCFFLETFLLSQLLFFLSFLVFLSLELFFLDHLFLLLRRSFSCLLSLFKSFDLVSESLLL